MLKFDNPPHHVSKGAPRSANPLPILHGFNPATGNYFRDGNEFPGLLIFQPICYRWKHVARHGEFKKEWLDVMFLTRFNRLGLLSISDWHALDLYESLQILKIRQVQPYGAWLCMNRRVNEVLGDRRTYIPFVDTFYWSSRWDCMNAERVLFDLKTKPWSQN